MEKIEKFLNSKIDNFTFYSKSTKDTEDFAKAFAKNLTRK